MFVVRTYLRVSNITIVSVNRTVVCNYNTQSIRKGPNIICLFNLHAEYIMENAGLDEAQAGIKIAGRNINQRYADDNTLVAESEEELKRLLMKVKEECGKSWLKAQHSEN